MRIGVGVVTSEIPTATNNPFNTANAFKIGLADWGPVGTAAKCLSINDVSTTIGPRSTTNQTLWDACDTHFKIGGGVLYVSRIVGTTPVAATLTLQDVTPHPTVVVTAKYSGAYGNSLYVKVTIVSTNYTVTIQDVSGNVLETHGPFANASGNAPLLADTSSTLVNFTQSAGSGFTTVSPNTLTATALATGTSDSGTVALANLQAALDAFSGKLGPGQVSADGYTNTTVSGIWSALDVHANAKNRVAIKDTDDGQTAATIVSAVGSYGTATTASWGGFWAGRCQVPGITPGTTRTVPASSVISALCSLADATGNPNIAAAGDRFPLKYVTGFTGTNGAPLYSQTDIDTLNAAGINSFNVVFGVNENYGFVTPVLQTTDTVYWQLNHARLRMAIVAAFQVIAQPFVFSQLDGQGLDIAAFAGDLGAYLSTLADPQVGAISTLAPDGSQDQGFTVDTSPNTPTTIAAGQLLANVSARFSPFAQLVQIQLNAIPATQSL